jgi:hypothetical protein
MPSDPQKVYRKERRGRKEFKGFFALLAVSAVSFEGRQ